MYVKVLSKLAEVEAEEEDGLVTLSTAALVLVFCQRGIWILMGHFALYTGALFSTSTL